MAKATKLPSGTWRCIASYTDAYGNHKQKSFTAPTKVEAEYLAKEFQLKKKQSRMPKNKTLDDIFKEFIANRTNLLSPTTVIAYDKYRRTAFPSIINLRLERLTKELYQSAINAYAEGHSPKTVREAHSFARKVLRANDVFIAENTDLPKKKKEEVAIPSPEEVKKFLAYLRDIGDDRMFLYVSFAAYLGLRKGEILALQWKDIDFDSRTVSITKGRVKTIDREEIIKDPKTVSGIRSLRIPKPLLDALPEKGKDEEFIFGDTSAAMDDRYRRVRDKAGFNYNFHALRHYYASVLQAQGMPDKYAMEMMGHATDNMLKRVYQHTFATKKEEYADKLDDYFDSFDKGE